LAARYKQFAPDPDLHGTFFPADIYPGESVSASIRLEGSLDPLISNARVWRLSPLGLEIVADVDYASVRGQPIQIDLRLGQERVSARGVCVHFDASSAALPILGIRLVESNDGAFGGQNRRAATRWIFGMQFGPVCVAANPARFNDFVYFRVRDVSAKGMQLSTSLRNKFLVKGMRLNCILSLPLVSQLTLQMSVQHVELSSDPDRPSLIVGTSLIDPSQSDLQALGQYLVQFGEGVQLDELRQQGLMPRRISSAVEFSFVRTVNEYNQVLALRHLAYQSAGKVCASSRLEDMSEQYDARSRIVIGKYHGRIIASAALVFNEYHDKMEIEESLDWPHDLPRRDEMVEVIRNCTHPSYRGSDLLMAMFKFIAITVLQAKRRFVVIGCTPDLVPLYTKIGMKNLDLEYRHGKLANTLHNVMLGDIPQTMTGSNINPILWNAIWSDTMSYMTNSNLLKPNVLDSVRVKLYRALKPLSVLLESRMRHPRSSSAAKRNP